MSTRVARRPALLLAALGLVVAASAGSTADVGPLAPRAATPPAPASAPALVHEPALALARPSARTTPRRPTSKAKRAALATRPYRPFSRQAGKRPWWNRTSGIPGSAWVYPYFPTACYQADSRAGGVNASAWQVLWVYPGTAPDRLAGNLKVMRLAVRGAQSIFAASAGRYVANRKQLFARSLAPRFVTTPGCQPDVRAVRVPAAVYATGIVWPGDTSATPFGAGTLTDWLLKHGYAAPNRKYLVVLQSSPSYQHYWAGISEDPAAQAGRAGEVPTRDNPANYTSFSYIDSSWVLDGGRTPADAAYPAQLIAHEMTHALGAMTASAPHDSRTNPLHPTDCWDLLCYNPPTTGQTYRNGCGNSNGWRTPRLARGYLRLDCNRDDYWAPATDGGLRAGAWTAQRWAVSSSSFLYGNTQPTKAQLAAHARHS